MLVIKIGGPAYRIGMGGGAASSVPSGGSSRAELDFNAVQVRYLLFYHTLKLLLWFSMLMVAACHFVVMPPYTHCSMNVGSIGSVQVGWGWGRSRLLRQQEEEYGEAGAGEEALPDRTCPSTVDRCAI